MAGTSSPQEHPTKEAKRGRLPSSAANEALVKEDESERVILIIWDNTKSKILTFQKDSDEFAAFFPPSTFPSLPCTTETRHDAAMHLLRHLLPPHEGESTLILSHVNARVYHFSMTSEEETLFKEHWFSTMTSEELKCRGTEMGYRSCWMHISRIDEVVFPGWARVVFAAEGIRSARSWCTLL